MCWRSFVDPALLIGFWGNIITAVILPIWIGFHLIDLILGAPAGKDHQELAMSRSRKSRSCPPTRPRRKGLLIVRDELAGRIAGMNAYNAGGRVFGIG
jgi:hypothetical protein